MKWTLIAVAVLLVVFFIVAPRSSAPPAETPLPDRLLDDDGITSPSDTPQQRQNQILMCREIVKSNPPGAAELTGNCKKLLARFDAGVSR